MKLTVVRNGIVEEVFLKEGECIQEGLTRCVFFHAAPCGGNGTCGKCTIKILRGDLPVTRADELKLTKEQRNNGVRLACQAYPVQDVTIEIGALDKFEVLTSGGKVITNCQPSDKQGYGIAIDIGTTTIAMECIELDSGKVLGSIGELNKQSSYGADVISRISACNNGRLEEISRVIRLQLSEMMQSFHLESITKISIVANTTMSHILMGYDCSTLGVYPYKPVNINTIHVRSRQLFGDSIPDCEVVLLPGISTYIGADIVAGMLQCGFAQSQKVSLLIDLGTNGEMAIGTKDKILVTSAAAGPAFEGGNISCGTGSIPGAISSVDLVYGFPKIKTIQDKPPAGICGSGVLELMSELFVNHIMDETGLLKEDYLEEGFPVVLSRNGEIVFLQEDIREVQMAKSAVCSALILLVKKYGITLDEVEKVYLAGGFGFYVNIEKAIKIGLLPKEWDGKIEAVGNTALKGAELVLTSDEFVKQAKDLVEVSRELTLASEAEFGELYARNMFLGECSEDII